MSRKRLNLTQKGLILFSLALLGACSDENPWMSGNGEGGINPSLNVNGNVESSAPKYQKTATGTIDAPEVSDFSLTLTKSDGSYSKTWASYDLFPSDQGFKTGTYTLAADYGSKDEEGFEKPWFHGEQTFDVLEDQTTDVSITARLANTMVSINYTDAFKAFFKDYATTLHSEGGSYIDYVKDETRPAYLKPGTTTLTVALTKQNGVSATFQPASFETLAQHHYNITLDVYNGEVGEAQLQITFDDSLEQEEVNIDLSDELMTAPAPQIIAKGFTPDETLELLEGTTPSSALQFYIKAQSGITSAVLTSTIGLDGEREYDLCSIDDSKSSRLASIGVKETGLHRNPGTLAQLDLTGLIANLPEGTHEFTLVVKDKMTKVNDPVTMKVEITPLTLTISSVSSVAYGTTAGELVLAYNGSDLKSHLTIEAQDDYGTYRECDITSVAVKSDSRRRYSDKYPTSLYTVKVTLPDTSRDIAFRVKYDGQVKAEGTFNKVQPVYEIEADGFAHKAVIKVTPEESSLLSSIVTNMRVFVGSTELNVASRDTSKGLVIVDGLTANMTYTIKTTINKGDNPTFTNTAQVSTEDATAVPNGDFETLEQTYNVTSMDQGGTYTRTLISSAMQNKQAFTVSEPQGWATTNAKTCNLSASTQNSWFVTLSAYNTSLYWLSTVATQGGMGGQTSTPDVYSYTAQNGSNAMVIRNVAWDPAGTTPSKESKTAIPSGYYNSKAPSSIAYRAAGKLFLGSYSYSNGTETYNEGVSFTSRPTALKGYYRYTLGPDSSEKGTVTVKLLNGSTVIGTGTVNLSAVSAYTEFTVPITYSNYFVKATSLQIMFASSQHASSSISTETSNIKTTDRAELYLQESYGAVLVIDNLSFTY
jgi:hypothetical protein